MSLPSRVSRRPEGAALSPAVPPATSRYRDSDARSRAPASAIAVQAAWLAATNDVGHLKPSNIYIARFGIKDPGPIRTFLLNFVPAHVNCCLAPLCLRSGSCTLARTFASRFVQTSRRNDALALPYDFTSIRLRTGTFHPS